MIDFFENVNGVLVNKEEKAFNPECDIAIIKGISNYSLIKKIGCIPLYDVTENYRALYTKLNTDLFDFIQGMKGQISSIDEDFDKVMKAEKLDKGLGNVRIYKINFTVNLRKSGAVCEPCEC